MPNWQPTTLTGIKAGEHYLFSIFSDIDQAGLIAILAEDWGNVTLTPGSANMGNLRSWHGDVVASNDLPNGPSQQGPINGAFGMTVGTITYNAIFQDMPPSFGPPAPPPVPEPPQLPPPPVPIGPPPPKPPSPPNPSPQPQPQPMPSPRPAASSSSMLPMVGIIAAVVGIAAFSGRR